MDTLPELLDRVSKRPHMFVHPVSFVTMRSYLNGLASGLRLSGLEYTSEEYLAAAEERGWDARGNVGIVRDFTAKALTDDEMVRELIAVEIEAYTRALARTG